MYVLILIIIDRDNVKIYIEKKYFKIDREEVIKLDREIVIKIDREIVIKIDRAR